MSFEVRVDDWVLGDLNVWVWNGMIRVLDQMGKTDWVGITVSILVPILSALVVFYLSKHQIDLESKRQYNLDTQKENQSLATKTKLDK